MTLVLIYSAWRGAPDADAAAHLGNVVSMLEWSTTTELAELRKVPERDVWLMHPAIVNAWYSPNHNTISKRLAWYTQPTTTPSVRDLYGFHSITLPSVRY
jgi:hypothetical protein